MRPADVANWMQRMAAMQSRRAGTAPEGLFRAGDNCRPVCKNLRILEPNLLVSATGCPMVTIPPLSVVMPVRNALPYLDAAVESILGQTFKDFEFVIRDDDSTDGSYERLRFWAASDKRIRLFEGDSCLGPAGSSNWVVGKARAPIVARMDADDVALPHRFRHQLSVLNDNPDAVLIGSVWEGIDRQGRVVRGPDLSALGTSRFSA